jgi:hypothetical protein
MSLPNTIMILDNHNLEHYINASKQFRKEYPDCQINNNVVMVNNMDEILVIDIIYFKCVAEIYAKIIDNEFFPLINYFKAKYMGYYETINEYGVIVVLLLFNVYRYNENIPLVCNREYINYLIGNNQIFKVNNVVTNLTSYMASQ